ncbi:MAG: DUF559 domain-containing protein [Longimicrobiales bacterium]|nr:DUF559 domain-containing protein [Longimicrobiales bacterium]
MSHRSAAGMHRLLERSAAHDPVEVLVRGVVPVRRAGILARRTVSLPGSDVTSIDGIPVTAVARTLVDLGLVLDSLSLERVVAHAEREGLVDRPGLVAAAEAARGRPGAPRLRSIVDGGFEPALTRSEAEVRFLHLVREARLPPPEVNVRLIGYEVDFLWRTRRIAVEVDGYRFHSSRRQFRTDRRRDSQLAAAGVQVIRLTWEQIVEEPLATIAELAQALVLAPGFGHGE